MPRIKSAKKALRQSIKREKVNSQKMKSLKTSIKKYQKSLSGDNKDVLIKSLADTYKALDKAAKTKLIKKNKARRLKSRLAQRMTKSNNASS